MYNKTWDGITYTFLSFNDATFQVLEYISNFIAHVIYGHILTYPCWDYIQTMGIKEASRGHHWGYKAGTLSFTFLTQVTTTLLKGEYPKGH